MIVVGRDELYTRIPPRLKSLFIFRIYWLSPYINFARWTNLSCKLLNYKISLYVKFVKEKNNEHFDFVPSYTYKCPVFWGFFSCRQGHWQCLIWPLFDLYFKKTWTDTIFKLKKTFTHVHQLMVRIWNNKTAKLEQITFSLCYISIWYTHTQKNPPHLNK